MAETQVSLALATGDDNALSFKGNGLFAPKADAATTKVVEDLAARVKLLEDAVKPNGALVQYLEQRVTSLADTAGHCSVRHLAEEKDTVTAADGHNGCLCFARGHVTVLTIPDDRNDRILPNGANFSVVVTQVGTVTVRLPPHATGYSIKAHQPPKSYDEVTAVALTQGQYARFVRISSNIWYVYGPALGLGHKTTGS